MRSKASRAVFFRCLATLFENGVPLVHAVELMAEQSEDRQLAGAAADMALQLNRGHRLSQSMQRHPNSFSRLHIGLVRVGENAGSLGPILTRLAIDEERAYTLSQRLRAALALPLLITGTCLLLIVVVAPMLLGSVIQQMAVKTSELPWPTLLLITLSGALRNPFFWVLIAGLGLAVQQALARVQPEKLAEVLDRVPGLGPALRTIATTRFSYSLETSLSVGFPVLQALDLAGQGCGHELLRLRLREARRALENGEELDRGLQSIDFFPTLFVQGVRAGQESGRLPDMLARLSEMYRLEVDCALDSFSRLLEPLVIAVMGVVVGFSIIATLLPLAHLIDSL